MRVRAIQVACVVFMMACTSDEGMARKTATGAGGAGTSGGAGLGAPAPVGSSAPSTVSAAEGQLSPCARDSDCTGGLECYSYGGFCTAVCATDADCAGVAGARYTCYVAPAFGGTRGGMTGGSGGAGDAGTAGAPAAPMRTGLCRIECTGPGDTSCPAGLMCIDVGGGRAMAGMAGSMAGTYRCGRPDSGGSTSFGGGSAGSGAGVPPGGGSGGAPAGGSGG